VRDITNEGVRDTPSDESHDFIYQHGKSTMQMDRLHCLGWVGVLGLFFF